MAADEQTQRSREWIIAEDHFLDELGQPVENAFRQAVVEELAACEHLMFRTGRAITVTPVRLRKPRPLDGQEEWVTVGYVFREVFVPAAREVPAAVPDQPGELQVVEGPAPEQPELEPVA